ncbi:MAG: OsmC family protein [Balneolaceae bacterium]|nr:OsmC family protein [Balneolaceae bacterium]MCH8549672.1 OsmC family protein [Balneolaceae bacterium]
MADTKTLKESHNRIKKLLTIKPSKGQYTTTTKVRLRDGSTCDIQHKHWTFIGDVGKEEGGNDAGPGPSVLQRGALGSCLAIGYSKWAAVLGVPVNGIGVDVEADVDARGTYGMDDVEPGYKGLRYRVHIDSPASEEEIMNVIEQADKHSPLLADFVNPVKVERKVEIVRRSKVPDVSGLLTQEKGKVIRSEAEKREAKSPSFAKASEDKQVLE